MDGVRMRKVATVKVPKASKMASWNNETIMTVAVHVYETLYFRNIMVLNCKLIFLMIQSY